MHSSSIHPELTNIGLARLLTLLYGLQYINDVHGCPMDVNARMESGVAEGLDRYVEEGHDKWAEELIKMGYQIGNEDLKDDVCKVVCEDEDFKNNIIEVDFKERDFEPSVEELNELEKELMTANG